MEIIKNEKHFPWQHCFRIHTEKSQFLHRQNSFYPGMVGKSGCCDIDYQAAAIWKDFESEYAGMFFLKKI